MLFPYIAPQQDNKFSKFIINPIREKSLNKPITNLTC